MSRKLNLAGRELFFGHHRNDFGRLVGALEPLDRSDGLGCHVIPFIERYFVWGGASGEAKSRDPRPIEEDWIGILHVPFDAPQWHSPQASPENFFLTPLWQASRPACRGIITLSADLQADLRAYDPALATLAVRHPTELDVQMFDINEYLARPRVVQVGDWLRKLQAIHRLRAPRHERVILLKPWTENYLEHEIAVFGDQRDAGVIARKMVPNEEVPCALVQFRRAVPDVCNRREQRGGGVHRPGTPLLINPLPAVVEYLGPDYPLYAADEVEADRLLGDPARIRAAQRHLLQRRMEIDLTYEGFCRDIAASEFYARL